MACGVAASEAGGEPFVGVNLGGWLVLEDWIWASEMADAGIPDEHTLVAQHGGPDDPSAVALMTAHWDTFVTEADLDRVLDAGISHVRLPLGWWLLFEGEVNSGFVQGGSWYLSRLLAWLRVRGMRAVLSLHALPGAQTAWQSFTGVRSAKAYFFLNATLHEQGRKAMRRLAGLISGYEANATTTGVVLGMELVNEPDWTYWDTSPLGIRTLFEAMVPELRATLPADRYALYLSFMDSPHLVSASWLALMRDRDPGNFTNVVYDAHVYHTHGDNNAKGRQWREDVDACKTCCRDPEILAPIADRGIPMIVGEWVSE